MPICCATGVQMSTSAAPVSMLTTRAWFAPKLLRSRVGCSEAPSEAELASPFPVEPRRMGLRAGLDLDDVGGLLDFLDGPILPPQTPGQ